MTPLGVRGVSDTIPRVPGAWMGCSAWVSCETAEIITNMGPRIGAKTTCCRIRDWSGSLRARRKDQGPGGEGCP
jgi:hypothetical protein